MIVAIVDWEIEALSLTKWLTLITMCDACPLFVLAVVKWGRKCMCLRTTLINAFDTS